jgi:hypothetical protein
LERLEVQQYFGGMLAASLHSYLQMSGVSIESILASVSGKDQGHRWLLRIQAAERLRCNAKLLSKISKGIKNL